MKLTKKEILEELSALGIDPGQLPVDFFTFDKVSVPNKKHRDNTKINVKQFEPMHIPLYGYSGRKINPSYKPISKLVLKDGILNKK